MPSKVGLLLDANQSWAFGVNAKMRLGFLDVSAK